MARIIGGIGTSHVPTIGIAYDKGRRHEPAWAPLFEGYEPVARWIAQQQPDALMVFYNDHANSFFFDFWPTFALGVSATFPLADEGAGRRPLPAIKGHPELAIHLAEQLVNDEFDLTVFQDKPLDHGLHSALPLLWPHEPDWPGAVVPLQINVLQYPMPTALRCYKLGQAVRRAIESYPQDLRVVVVGTGGLSHQIHGERTGFNNPEWDHRFLDLLRDDPAQLTALRHADYVRLGGAEGAEVIMWLAMRGALAAPGGAVRELHRSYYLATTTAMAVTLYEPVESTTEVAA
ncbi:MAG TPA: gallate dioxygenase [Ramlibacter sp.]|nr:gallate dioxygenase [Ramlibacter sp.]